MKTICILSHIHLSSNPRVVKEANTLARNGYNITILTSFSSEELLKRDYKLIEEENIDYIGVVDIIPGHSNSFVRLMERAKSRIARELNYRFNIATPHALGYGYSKILKKARSLKADLYIAHLELGFCVGYQLQKEGLRVGFDFEDWYSEDLLPGAQRYRPINLLKKAESTALKNGVYSISTSQAMSKALAENYQTKEPHILYNVFSLSDRNRIDNKSKDRQDKNTLSFFWYSQTIGPGRGIEYFMEALNQVNYPIQLHLRGHISQEFKTKLKESFPFHKKHQLFFHPQVEAGELLSRIAEHDIGLALESNSLKSRNYTITNKMFQYLQAGLGVIATDTSGQKEAYGLVPNAIRLFSSKDITSLVTLIEQFAVNKELVENCKKAAIDGAKNYFNWESEQTKLIQIVHSAFNSKKSSLKPY